MDPDAFHAPCDETLGYRLVDPQTIGASYPAAVECQRQRWTHSGPALFLHDGAHVYVAGDGRTRLLQQCIPANQGTTTVHQVHDGGPPANPQRVLRALLPPGYHRLRAGRDGKGPRDRCDNRFRRDTDE